MTPKRPRDPNHLAKSIITTGKSEARCVRSYKIF
jgi:hypothetical protein